MRDLSVLIASRNEAFLNHTINDLLAHAELDTEVLVLLDGAWPVEPVPDNPKVTLIHRPTSIGQRAAVVELARLSRAKFIAKCDAHVSVDQGFDRKLAEACEYNVALIPRLYNLHAFNRRCNVCGHEVYQGAIPEKCEKCGRSEGFERVMVWQPRWNKRTDFARFGADLVYGYWSDYEKRPEAQGDLCDTMSFLGAFWFQHRERFWELGGLDLAHGGWGNLGTEVSLANQLSEEGALKVLKTTFYSHMFRTNQGPDWGFPYPLSGNDVAKARAHSRDLWMNGKFAKQAKPLSYVVEKYWPVPGWSDEDLGNLKKIESKRWLASMLVSNRITEAPAIIKSGPTKSIVFYTDCLLPDPIAEAVQRQILRSFDGQIVSVSLGKALDFGENIIVERERSVVTMYHQILAGLEKASGKIVYMAEHDVLYNQSHYEYIPPRKDAYLYNLNLWRVDAATGRALFYITQSQSQLVAYREALLAHYRKRIERIEKDGHYSRSIGHEPGLFPTPRGIDNLPALSFCSAYPNVDIRHSGNLTKSRWNRRQFKDKNTCLGWTPADEIPFWGRTAGRFDEFLAEIASRKKE